MITDSQVGIPRPTGLRRTEARGPRALLGLVTDHYVAKLVSILFAVVLIVLIDRELESKILEGYFDVRVGDGTRAVADATGRRQIVLDPEPGVAVRSAKPAQVHVIVKGPAKLEDKLKSKSLTATVPIKKSWLKDGSSVSRTIDGSSIEFPGVRGVSVTLDLNVDVEIEPEVVRDLPLSATAVDLPPDLTADVAFDPPTMRVFGPASLLRPGAIETITIPIPAAGRTEAFSVPVTALPESYSQKQIRMSPEQRIVADVTLTKALPRSLDPFEVPIRFQVSPDTQYQFAIIDFPRNTVSVTLSGAPQAVAYWQTRMDELKQRVRAVIDVERLINKEKPRGEKPTSVFADVEILGIPDNLKRENVTPAQVDVSVTKRDS
jgi:hypothetical protein